MDTTAAPTTAAARSAVPVSRWRVAIGAGLVAAVATTSIASIARASGAALEVGGEPIPLYAFAQLTLLAAIVGGGIAVLLARRSTQPRRSFLRFSVALTALSIVPDLAVDSTVGTKFVLAFTHLVAAAVIVPQLAKRLAG